MRRKKLKYVLDLQLVIQFNFFSLICFKNYSQGVVFTSCFIL